MHCVVELETQATATMGLICWGDYLSTLKHIYGKCTTYEHKKSSCTSNKRSTEIETYQNIVKTKQKVI